MRDIAIDRLPGVPTHDVWDVAREACERARDIVARSVQQRQSVQLAAGRSADDARRRGLLTVQELWLRFVALGGNADLLEVEGFLAGVMLLAPNQRAVLAQALREQRLDLLHPTGAPPPVE